MSGNGLHRVGAKHFCTIEHAEQLAHSAYLLARKEVAEEMRKMALAFEARIVALTPQPSPEEPS